MSSTKVVNIKRNEPYDVYIGRPSIFGNRFVIGVDGDRQAVIARYREEFYARYEVDEWFRAQVRALEGKRLGCFCKPLSCHGDVIVECLERLKDKADPSGP